MSAFTFRLDRDGHVCGGTADTSSRSDETWRLTAFPVRSLEETGVEICWPNGETWEHGCITFANSHETRRKSTSQEAA